MKRTYCMQCCISIRMRNKNCIKFDPNCPHIIRPVPKPAIIFAMLSLTWSFMLSCPVCVCDGWTATVGFANCNSSIYMDAGFLLYTPTYLVSVCVCYKFADNNKAPSLDVFEVEELPERDLPISLPWRHNTPIAAHWSDLVVVISLAWYKW